MKEETNGDSIKLTVPGLIMTFFKRQGPWAALALILLAALLGWIPSPMLRMLDILNRQVQVLEAHDRNSSVLRQEIIESTNYQNSLLRTLCRSMVPQAQQAACEPRYKGYEEKP